ncbi:uncharacterized protein LOC106507207 [Sus scrofa]|uniref:uncharacterized protein LOC106507207 n=1 Tax=Sus scrofa TaxID=9823 RepID=UPI000A2B19E0|nr:uncharacterized protein LOC106507207 [Sus scrofa]
MEQVQQVLVIERGFHRGPGNGPEACVLLPAGHSCPGQTSRRRVLGARAASARTVWAADPRGPFTILASSFLQKSEGRQWGWGKEFLFLKNITAARAPFGASRPAGWARGRRGPAGSQCTVRLVLTPAPARPRPRPLVSRPRHRLSASAANLWQLVREGTIAAGSVWLASAEMERMSTPTSWASSLSPLPSRRNQGSCLGATPIHPGTCLPPTPSLRHSFYLKGVKEYSNHNYSSCGLLGKFGD